MNHQDSSDSDSSSDSESSKLESDNDTKSPKYSHSHSHSHSHDDDTSSSDKHSSHSSSSKSSSSSSQRYTEDDSIKPSHNTMLTEDDPAIRDAILDILRKHGIHPDQQGQQAPPSTGEDPNIAIKRAIAEALTKGDAKATQVKDSVKQALKTIQDEWLQEIDRQDQILKSNQTSSIKSGVHDVAHSIDDLIRTEIDEANKMSHTIQQQANKGKPQTNIEVGSLPTSQSSILNVLIMLAIVVMGVLFAVYYTRAKNDYTPIQ